ncbi:hypothetical protein CIHG_05020 [Coccidioides immitis H538.4]|uniref:YCII-related domain-containing protein n=3 Tax=Coccidioides immitis TaxID=5501 RepID=A0A0J8QLX0_COCIT|nr:hypothetical protein CIRG_03952 [Coccidioides immitis RMSCC 2394]KMU73390.1 hypothetical protein CISG_03525 [Coccidioides immitis RMSCC 3703]KMU87080.1 hypothetical protein CIHG_05020 [Coccidioides immitis H538.4]
MSQKYEWFVRLPDRPDVLETRLENRPLHVSHNKPLMENGTITFGGPLLSSQPTSMEEGLQKITGSIHLIKARTEEEVWELVRDDPYAKLEVWDLEKAEGDVHWGWPIDEMGPAIALVAVPLNVMDCLEGQ